MIVLGIETSCDDTSVAVLDGNRILSNVVSSQVKVHEAYGGVVPELASRHHLDNISWVLNQAIAEAKLQADQLQGIGVTYGPGLVGSLLVGLNMAKGLAYSWKIPFVGVNHLEAHLNSVFLEHPDAELPMLCVIASGGHTSLYHLRNRDDYSLLGETRDDAIGEAFDKVAKMLGLGYPGGPVIDRLAAKQAGNALQLSRANFGAETYDFSYSGIKTAVLYYLQRNGIPPYSGDSPPATIVEVCRSFQTVAIDMLMDPVRRAARALRPRSVSFSGGVACNSYLRLEAAHWSTRENIPVYFPSIILSTDNAAMIAAVAHYKLGRGITSPYSLNADPNLRY
jgi:tRNA N6-adenosine threonylcarbamoyltransferase